MMRLGVLTSCTVAVALIVERHFEIETNYSRWKAAGHVSHQTLLHQQIASGPWRFLIFPVELVNALVLAKLFGIGG